MIISDLSHLENVSDASQVNGGTVYYPYPGLAIADSKAIAKASGTFFAGTSAFTYTNTYSGFFYVNSKSVAQSSSASS